MIMKGIIIEQLKGIVDGNEILTNRYNVRIPILEAQGSNDKAILECGLCYQPGNVLGYYPGDVVYVGFEQDNLNQGLILGKLYTTDNVEGRSESNPYNLIVDNNAVLPYDTLIDGMNVVDEIRNLKLTTFNEQENDPIGVLDLR